MAKTLGEIRKAIQLSTASDITGIMKMFLHICKNDPEAVKASFDKYLRSLPEVKQDNMVELYADMASYLETLFEVK